MSELASPRRPSAAGFRFTPLPRSAHAIVPRPVAATVAAAVLFGTAALTLAAAPTTKPTAPTLKPGQETAETANQHIQNLRQIRRTLNEALKMLENEAMADGDIQRPEAIRSIQVAVDHVNTEVKDFEAAQKKAGK